MRLKKPLTVLLAAWLAVLPLVLLAATGSVTPITLPGGNAIPPFVPISVTSDWVTACDAPTTADNSGNTVVNPGAITRANQFWVQMTGRGTTLQIRLKYPTAGTVTAATPVIQAFGRDSKLVPERLVDKDAAHALTLTVDTTNDARETVGNFSFTHPVEVDCNANKEVLVAVKTALAGSNLTGSVIQVRVK